MFCCAQVISISDPNERDVCHTLEVRIHEYAPSIPLLPRMLLPPQRLTGAYQASSLADMAPFPVLSGLHKPVSKCLCSCIAFDRSHSSSNSPSLRLSGPYEPVAECNLFTQSFTY